MSTDHETVDAVGESNDQTDLGNKQSKEHSKGVGQYFSLDTIDKLLEFARGAQPAPIYASYPGIHVPYELLKREGWKDKVSSLADMWVASADNIRRAEACAGRKAELPVNDLVRAFGMFRLRERTDHAGWIPVPDGLGNDVLKLQTTVYVALTDLSPENGFFMHLKKGADVCIESKAKVKFPQPGGGLGISFVLDL